MKTIKDKQILVGADFAGFPLKEAVVAHLKKKGWTVTDVGMKADDAGTPEMYHRIGLRAGAMIAEGEFERAILFEEAGNALRNLFFIALCLRFNRHRQNRLRKFNTGKYDILTFFT